MRRLENFLILKRSQIAIIAFPKENISQTVLKLSLSLSLFSKPLQFPLFLSSSLAHAPTRPFRLSDFEIGRALGKGKFGRVFMARTKPSVSRASGTSSVAPPNGGGGYIVALKTLYKSELINTPMEKQLRREIEIQMNLR